MAAIDRNDDIDARRPSNAPATDRTPTISAGTAARRRSTPPPARRLAQGTGVLRVPPRRGAALLDSGSSGLP